jgi:Ca2+/Na+ antiporter
VDKTQYYALLGYVRSIRRLLIYILATLFGVLCFAIVEFEHTPLVWVLLYPIIFVFIVMVEIRMARKKQRELEQEAPTPPNESLSKRDR